jgi:hypothetical protein
LDESKTESPKKEDSTKEHLMEMQSSQAEKQEKAPGGEVFFLDFAHILQFFHLCSKKKMPPVQYSTVSNPTIDRWFNNLWATFENHPKLVGSKRNNLVIVKSPDSESSLASPANKISRKDKYFIHTLLKIHDTMDKNYKEKSDKEPSFARLEEHCKNLI